MEKKKQNFGLSIIWNIITEKWGLCYKAKQLRNVQGKFTQISVLCLDFFHSVNFGGSLIVTAHVTCLKHFYACF